MKVISIRGLDNKANIALNEAFLLASRKNSDNVNSGYLLLTLLRNIDVSKALEIDTGISRETYKDAFSVLMSTIDKEETENSKEDKDRPVFLIDNQDEIEQTNLTISDLSEELYKILSSTIEKVLSRTNKHVTSMQLYRAILGDKEAFAWEVLKLAGANKDTSMSNLDNPLENMPITAQFAVDYNGLAKDNRFDPIEAREDVIDSVFEVLGRRIKNNPCIVGEAGVGKTAIVEGMAQRLIKGNVPHYLKEKHIISVDISGIVSGARFRGDFEERLNGILNEAAANKNVILFFDEFHMLAEAGSNNSDSAMTASNILKPAISRGDVQIIGATTTSEYKKFIEKDKAFERRVQMVAVPEPTVEQAIKMVNAVIGEYNRYHNSKLQEGVVELAVVLSDRYITDKRLPDKAITVIDETAARLKKLVTDEVVTITEASIKKTISKLTGVDISEMDDTARNKVKNLEDSLKKHVIGQNNAIKYVSKSIRRSKAGIQDPNRPIGSFLFVGPTGVGKTELSKALAIEFSGSVNNMLRFDMSEFMEKHSVSKLIGSPPGYVGYGEGGRLTEAVRHNPYSIVLFDEIEKAHPEVFNILLQVLDDGVLTDSEGTKVDFKNTVIILTSNAGYGANMLNKKSIGFGAMQAEDKRDGQEEIAIKALEETFRPEFLNRLDKIVVFNELSEDDSKEIVKILLTKLEVRMRANGIKLSWDKSLVEYLVKEGFSQKYGARNLKRKIQTSIEDILADKIIDEEVNKGDCIKMSYSDKLNISIRKSLVSEEQKEISMVKMM